MAGQAGRSNSESRRDWHLFDGDVFLTAKSRNLKMMVSVLGSGSGGNSIVLRSGADSIMIDAGFALGELLMRLKDAEIDLDSIRAIFITHGHCDHVGGAADMARHIGVSVRMTEELFINGTQDASGRKPWLNLTRNEVSLFSAWDKIVVSSFQVTPVPVSHDSPSTVGFVVTAGAFKLAIVTDAGKISKEAMEAMAGSDIIMIESNHDNDMLWKSKRHFLLKKRIAGPMGHLNNASCAEILSELITERTKDVVLLHLSGECNTPELAAAAVCKKNQGLGDGSVRLHVASQNQAISFNLEYEPR